MRDRSPGTPANEDSAPAAASCPRRCVRQATFRIIRRTAVDRARAAADDRLRSLPFANVSRLLQQVPLPVPAILGHSDAIGVVALQDLGDVTLQAHLGATSPAEHQALYRQAVALIELFAAGVDLTETTAMASCSTSKAHVGAELLSGTFSKHAAKSAWRRNRAKLGEKGGDYASCGRASRAVPPRLSQRNLMLHDGSLGSSIFRTRMGPDTYDLASLLRDVVDIAIASSTSSSRISSRQLARTRRSSAAGRSDVAQRNLASASAQTTTRHNTVYIQYILAPTTTPARLESTCASRTCELLARIEELAS